jgi:hypothetical protein
VNDNISGRQFQEQLEFGHEEVTHHHSGITDRYVSVHAKHPDYGQIGEMQLSAFPDEKGQRIVGDIGVDFRRRGVATGMWQHAQQAGLNPVHSPDRTDKGDAWAKSVSGDQVTPRSTRRFYGDEGYEPKR